MTNPPESALNDAINCAYNADHGAFTRADVDQARAELRALRERCADLELLLRALGPFRMDDGSWKLEHVSTRDDVALGWHALPDDGTGLPLLTPEARAALRGGSR